MKRAAILGGGPSLPDDLQRLPADCTLISVNEHALWHCNPQYLVFQDTVKYKTKFVPNFPEILKEYRGIIITPFENSHVALPNGWWDGNQSSCLATWFACWMDFDEVILCGMDCYQGPVKYCHPFPGFDHPVFRAPLEQHLARWAMAFDHCPHPERISAMSGPLIEVFGAYVPGTQTQGTYVRKPVVRYQKPAWLERFRPIEGDA